MKKKGKQTLISEFLIRPDGRVFVQNLTPAMAAILLQLNPDEPAIKSRAARPYFRRL